MEIRRLVVLLDSQVPGMSVKYGYAPVIRYSCE